MPRLSGAAVRDFAPLPLSIQVERSLFGRWDRRLDRRRTVGAELRVLIDEGLDTIPLPGRGMTLERWRCLEQVGRHDLSLAKAYESHTDAIAILTEVGTRASPEPGVLYAVWASESPTAPLRANRPSSSGDQRLQDGSTVILEGSKAWCSGARFVDRGLVTLIDAEGVRRLALVSMCERGITLVDDRWQAVGMRDSATAELVFDGVPAMLVSGPNAYLNRAGFWHGGAGVAACWYGAAATIATRLRELQRGRKDLHARARLGVVDNLLASAAALLRECASMIDRDRNRMLPREVMRVRAAVADCCERVLHEAMHALGPGPFCTDVRLASMAADLPIFIRQVRGEHDLVAQADQLLADDDECAQAGWQL